MAFSVLRTKEKTITSSLRPLISVSTPICAPAYCTSMCVQSVITRTVTSSDQVHRRYDNPFLIRH